MRPDILCINLKVYCCKKNYHEESCIFKWRNLKIVLQDLILKDVGVAPYVPPVPEHSRFEMHRDLLIDMESTKDFFEDIYLNL